MDNITIEGLTAILRGKKPERRAAAAIELGKRHNVQAVESLIRALNEDPDESVRNAARTALSELLGAQAETAIQAYGVDSAPEDPWIREGYDEDAVQGYPKAGEDSASPGWDEEDLLGFISILRAGGDPAIRVRAIQELKTIRDMRAVDAIATMAVWSDEDVLQSEARKAMEELFGEESPKVLESYRKHGMYVVDEERFREEIDDLRMESGDDEEIEDQEWSEAPSGTDPVLTPTDQRKQEPVTREEKAGWGSAVLIGLAVIVIVVMALYLLRG